jgi:cation/acetate symporter
VVFRAPLGLHVVLNANEINGDVSAITLSFNGWYCRITARNCRFFTVKRVKDARKSAGYALVLIAILYTTAPAIAVLQKTNLIETVNGKDYSSMPAWFTKWETTGLLTFEDKK